ncbi:MAG: 16S rRNA (cytidine(1402)-2'-O)-methyltransferase [Pseudomonadota bacterium]
MAGQLIVAATPIGNLSDVSERLANALQAADLVLAEDTRVSSRLLAALGVTAKLKSLHEHNEAKLQEQIRGWLADGDQLVMISDAGTPLISDPGYRTVRAVRGWGYPVIPIPGPSALTAALSVAGLATDRFTFHGFLSSKPKERRRQLEALGRRPETQVLFEASHRISACLGDALAVLGAHREAFLAREMTKKFEQYRFGNLATLVEQVEDGTIPARGEFVLVLAGAADAEADLEEASKVVACLLDELPASQAARLAARLTGVDRKRCYALAMASARENR